MDRSMRSPTHKSWRVGDCYSRSPDSCCFPHFVCCILHTMGNPDCMQNRKTGVCSLCTRGRVGDTDTQETGL